MTNAEAIKIINCYDIGFYDLSGEKIPADKLAEAFDMAIEALRADRPQAKWIPCSERLPELHREDPAVNIEPQLNLMADYYMMSDPVLVMRNGPFTDKNERIMVAQYEDDLDGRVYWQTLDAESLPDVVAWMPLPAPYGGEPNG